MSTKRTKFIIIRSISRFCITEELSTQLYTAIVITFILLTYYRHFLSRGTWKRVILNYTLRQTGKCKSRHSRQYVVEMLIAEYLEALQELQDMVNRLVDTGRKYCMQIKIDKSQVMRVFRSYISL